MSKQSIYYISCLECNHRIEIVNPRINVEPIAVWESESEIWIEPQNDYEWVQTHCPNCHLYVQATLLFSRNIQQNLTPLEPLNIRNDYLTF